MSNQSLWLVPLASLVVIVLGLYALFDVEVGSPFPPSAEYSSPLTITAQPTATRQPAPAPTLQLPTFTEDWEGGDQQINGIDVESWKAYGDPRPLVKTSLGRDGNAAFDPNGDRNYDSGIVSRFDLKLEPGLAIEFWAKGRTNLEHWESVSVGISRGHFDDYDGVEGQPISLARIYISPATEAESVSYWLGQEMWAETFTPLDNSWHHYRMEIAEGGAMHFYRDGELKFTPQEPIDFDVYQQHPLVIEGRSEATDMLIDDLSVYGSLLEQTVRNLPSAATAFAGGYVLARDLGAVTQAAAGDLDGDGDLDLVTTSNSGLNSRILMFQNPGELSGFPWPEQILGKSSAMVSRIVVADFDSDGDLDVISGGGMEEDYELIAWENDGAPYDATWRANDVGAMSHAVQALRAADIDQDGDLDLISGSQDLAEVELLLWENNGSPFAGLWPRHELGATDDTIYALNVVDLDLDGDLDLASGGRRGEDYELIVWENASAPLGERWKATNVGATQGDIMGIAVADLDEDGYPDLVSSGGYRELNELLIWHNDGTPFDNRWQHFSPGVNPSTDASLVTVDFDQDGVMELVSGSQYARDGYEVVIWERTKTAVDAPWTAHPLGETADSVRWIEPVDLDGDADLDLVTTGDMMVVVWENQIK